MNFFERLQDVFGFGDPYDQYDYEYEEPVAAPARDPALTSPYEPPAGSPPTPQPSTAPPLSRSLLNGGRKIVEMPSATGRPVEFVVMEPRSFEDMPAAVSALRERKAVILNLTLMDVDQAQRSVDYLAGGTFAIDGDQERLGESIFLFTPSFVQISRYDSAPGGWSSPTAQPAAPAASVPTPSSSYPPPGSTVAPPAEFTPSAFTQFPPNP